MKQGYKTTEFYLALASLIVFVLMKTGIITVSEIDEWKEMLIVLLPVLFYNVGRVVEKTMKM